MEISGSFIVFCPEGEGEAAEGCFTWIPSKDEVRSAKGGGAKRNEKRMKKMAAKRSQWRKRCDVGNHIRGDIQKGRRGERVMDLYLPAKNFWTALCSLSFLRAEGNNYDNKNDDILRKGKFDQRRVAYRSFINFRGKENWTKFLRYKNSVKRRGKIRFPAERRQYDAITAERLRLVKCTGLAAARTRRTPNGADAEDSSGLRGCTKNYASGEKRPSTKERKSHRKSPSPSRFSSHTHSPCCYLRWRGLRFARRPPLLPSSPTRRLAAFSRSNITITRISSAFSIRFSLWPLRSAQLALISLLPFRHSGSRRPDSEGRLALAAETERPRHCSINNTTREGSAGEACADPRLRVGANKTTKLELAMREKRGKLGKLKQGVEDVCKPVWF